MVPPHLVRQEARWFHSDDYASPNLSKASLGSFFYEALKLGVHIGEVWPFNHRHDRSAVYITVFMTEEQKNAIEEKTKFRFRDPPKVVLA